MAEINRTGNSITIRDNERNISFDIAYNVNMGRERGFRIENLEGADDIYAPNAISHTDERSAELLAIFQENTPEIQAQILTLMQERLQLADNDANDNVSYDNLREVQGGLMQYLNQDDTSLRDVVNALAIAPLNQAINQLEAPELDKERFMRNYGDENARIAVNVLQLASINTDAPSVESKPQAPEAQPAQTSVKSEPSPADQSASATALDNARETAILLTEALRAEFPDRELNRPDDIDNISMEELYTFLEDQQNAETYTNFLDAGFAVTPLPEETRQFFLNNYGVEPTGENILRNMLEQLEPVNPPEQSVQIPYAPGQVPIPQPAQAEQPQQTSVKDSPEATGGNNNAASGGQAAATTTAGQGYWESANASAFSVTRQTETQGYSVQFGNRAYGGNTTLEDALSGNNIAQIQSLLALSLPNGQGYQAAIDGIAGTQTIAALQQYAAEYGVSLPDNLATNDESLLFALLRVEEHATEQLENSAAFNNLVQTNIQSAFRDTLVYPNNNLDMAAQHVLKLQGGDLGRWGVDGDLGSQSRAAFQSVYGTPAPAAIQPPAPQAESIPDAHMIDPAIIQQSEAEQPSELDSVLDQAEQAVAQSRLSENFSQSAGLNYAGIAWLDITQTVRPDRDGIYTIEFSPSQDYAGVDPSLFKSPDEINESARDVGSRVRLTLVEQSEGLDKKSIDDRHESWLASASEEERNRGTLEMGDDGQLYITLVNHGFSDREDGLLRVRFDEYIGQHGAEAHGFDQLGFMENGNYIDNIRMAFGQLSVYESFDETAGMLLDLQNGVQIRVFENDQGEMQAGIVSSNLDPEIRQRIEAQTPSFIREHGTDINGLRSPQQIAREIARDGEQTIGGRVNQVQSLSGQFAATNPAQPAPSTPAPELELESEQETTPERPPQAPPAPPVNTA